MKEVLTTIQQWDPDGWTYREPTERDREQFRNRVIARFGRKAWEDYVNQWDMPMWERALWKESV